MLLRNCADFICKQLLLPRPSIAVIAQPNVWFSNETEAEYPSPPKRARTAWVCYVSENLPQLKKEYPERTKSEIFSMMSSNWRKMDESLQKKYHELAKADSLKYKQEIEEYKANLTQEAKLALAKKKSAKEIPEEKVMQKKQLKQLKALGMPKRSPNAYILFSVDYIKKNYANPAAAFKESSKIAAIWSSLPDSEKSKWLQLAAEKDKEYREKLLKWESTMIAEGKIEVIQTKDKTK